MLKNQARKARVHCPIVHITGNQEPRAASRVSLLMVAIALLNPAAPPLAAPFGVPAGGVVLHSLISLQLPLAPMMVLAIGIKNPLTMPVDRLQRRCPCKEHRVVLLGRPG
jgi:hypothetical protein